MHVDHIAELYFAFCKGLDSPVSLSCWLLYSHKEYEQLAQKKVDPASYCDSDAFHVDYSAVSYLRKYEGLITDKKAPRRAAILGFHQTEEFCRETNKVLRALASGHACMMPEVDFWIQKVRSKIAEILGPCPTSYDEECDWGPGATDDLKKSQAYLDEKLTKLPISVTSRALPHLARAIANDPAWMRAICERNKDYPAHKAWYSIVHGGKYDTVPKIVLTDRSICKEPRGNGFLQKGIGSIIRESLRRAGCDLNDQSLNQTMASLAIDLDLATLDLESASDSVSKELVYFLLPIDWAVLLDDLRSSHVKVNKTWLELEKFSSMGNGFTFELESLIFYAITSVVHKRAGRRVFGVYGDDIVSHKECSATIVNLLQFLGFRLNRGKSYFEGVFYESCGGHYFLGRDVTPCYQKEVLRSKGSAIRASVRLVHLAIRLGADITLDKRVESAYRHAVRLTGLKEHEYGPIDLERDDYVQVASNELRPPRYKHGRPGFTVRHVVSKAAEVPAFESADLAIWLRRNNHAANNSLWSFGRDKREPIRLSRIPLNEYVGNVESRSNIRETTQHAWVQVPINTAWLAW